MIISVGEITWKEWGKFHQGFQVPFSHLYKVKMNSNKLIFLLSLKLYHNLKQFNYWCIFLTQFHLVSNINNLYILCLIVCKFICLSVRLNPINVKTAEPMTSLDPFWTCGKKYYQNFLFCFCTKRRCSQIKSWNRRWAAKSPKSLI